MYRIRRTDAKECIASVYARIVGKRATGLIADAKSLTPKELAGLSKGLFNCDISGFTSVLEKGVYAGAPITENDKMTAIEAYKSLRTAIRQYKRNKRRIKE
jgi:hypothetical protein